MFTAEERRNYIGGSDIAVIMGMSRWKTPLKLWLEKTGEADPDDLSQIEAVQLGTELEEFVAQKFARTTGKQVRKQSKMYVHKNYPFMASHIDRLITGTDEILECKTCGSHKKDEWEGDEIPKEYILQVIWYLGITGKKKAYIAVLIGGQSFKYKMIEFDKELFDVMVEMAKEFWNCVQTKTPPALTPDDNSVLSEIFAKPDEQIIENQDMEKHIEKIKEIKNDISVLETEQKMLEAELKQSIGEHLGVCTEKFKVTWARIEQTKVDTEKLKADGLYDTYTNKSSYRKLNISVNKKAA